MSDRAFETAVRSWLEAGSDVTPPAAIDAVLFAVKTTPQERKLRIPWRFEGMSNVTRLAAGLAVLVMAGVGVFSLAGGGPGQPTPPPTPAPTATFATQTVGFSSPTYGYAVQRPAAWEVTPATNAWPVGGVLDGGVSSWLDLFESSVSLSPEFDAVAVAAQTLPDGSTEVSWQADYAAAVEASGRDCKGPAGDWTSAELGGIAIRRLDLECQGLFLTDVTFVIDRTGYVMSGNREVIAQFLESFQPAG